ncbi:MAG: BatD family protein [Planctomycetota bacterium]
MKRYLVTSIFLLPLLAFGARGDNPPSISAAVERQRVYEGEPIQFEVELNNVKSAITPEIPKSDDFDVQFLGQAQQQSASFTIIINGRRVDSNTSGWRFAYRLTPLRSGRLTIPAPFAIVDGQKVEGRPIPITVIGADEQDEAIVEIDIDHKNVYPLQPFTVTLKIFLKALPGRFADTDPSNLRIERMLSIPWANDRELPSNLTPQGDLNQWLGKRISQDGAGFSIKDISTPAVSFGSFFRREATTFDFESKKVRHLDKAGKEADYWEYTLSRTFTAKAPGEYGFGPVSLKARVPISAGEGKSQFNLEEIYARTPKLMVDVKEVPRDGRPNSYTGAVGEFTFNATMKPEKAKVGDPMTLTLTLTGDGLLDTAGAPHLESDKELAELFRIHEGTEETKGRSRVFTYSVRPKSTEIREFPPVEIAYFDTRKEQYVVLHSDAIPLEISAADHLAGSEIIGGNSTNAETPAVVNEVRKDGLYANIVDPSALRNQRVAPVYWFGGMAALATAYGLASVAAVRVRKRHADPALQRRRHAGTRAGERINQGSLRIQEGQGRAAAEAFRAAVTGLVADLWNVEEAGLTPKDVERHVRERLGDEDIARRAREFVQHCDDARYAGDANVSSSLEKETNEVISALIAADKKKGRQP